MFRIFQSDFYLSTFCLVSQSFSTSCQFFLFTILSLNFRLRTCSVEDVGGSSSSSGLPLFDTKISFSLISDLLNGKRREKNRDLVVEAFHPNNRVFRSFSLNVSKNDGWWLFCLASILNKAFFLTLNIDLLLGNVMLWMHQLILIDSNAPN